MNIAYLLDTHENRFASSCERVALFSESTSVPCDYLVIPRIGETVWVKEGNVNNAEYRVTKVEHHVGSGIDHQVFVWLYWGDLGEGNGEVKDED